MGLEFHSVTGYNASSLLSAPGWAPGGHRDSAPASCSSAGGRGTGLRDTVTGDYVRAPPASVPRGRQAGVSVARSFPLCSSSAGVGCHPKGQRREQGFREAAEVTKMSAFRNSGNPYVWIFCCME